MKNKKIENPLLEMSKGSGKVTQENTGSKIFEGISKKVTFALSVAAVAGSMAFSGGALANNFDDAFAELDEEFSTSSIQDEYMASQEFIEFVKEQKSEMNSMLNEETSEFEEFSKSGNVSEKDVFQGADNLSEYNGQVDDDSDYMSGQDVKSAAEKSGLKRDVFQGADSLSDYNGQVDDDSYYMNDEGPGL